MSEVGKNCAYPFTVCFPVISKNEAETYPKDAVWFNAVSEPVRVVLPDILIEPDRVVNPTTCKDPVMLADPVYGKGEIFGAQEALNAWIAYEAVPNNDPVIPCDTFKDPVICWEPETITVPFSVWVSLVASPNIFDPDEYITDADSYCTFKNVIEAVPFIVTFPSIVPPVRGRYEGA